jgi:hypothetical protein
MKTLTCALAECGTPFERFPGSVRRYCSRLCQGRGARRTVIARYGGSCVAPIRLVPPAPLELHCSICARRFRVADLTTRTCSLGCGHRLAGLLQARRARAPVGRSAELLGILRERRSGFTSTSALAEAMYGLDDYDSRHAARQLLFRLRALYGMDGLVIESDGVGYRLARDLEVRARDACEAGS